MTLLKLLFVTAVALLGVIGIAFFFKGDKLPSNPSASTAKNKTVPVEVELEREVRVVVPVTVNPAKQSPAQPKPAPATAIKPLPIVGEAFAAPTIPQTRQVFAASPQPHAPLPSETSLPDADRIDELFRVSDPKLSLVETITYHSRVPWQKGRPAWLSDYATYYETSRHFIARSLRGKPAYFEQDIAEGDKFNVLKKDKPFSFYLLIDTSRCKMWFYYIDGDTNERVLLKTYKVGLGRQDSTKVSGLLTPLGKYALGDKIAIYKPNVQGYHQGRKIEMITVFGTRWIPFDQELSCCTAPAKGYGIHGVPWVLDAKNNLAEDKSCLGKYLSDGCIRMATEDIEELFAIVITKPTTIELVKDYRDAALPGKER